MTDAGIPRTPQLQTRCTEKPYCLATCDGPPRAAMTDLELHMKCSLDEIGLCSNRSCKSFTVPDMTHIHETARRLMAVGMAKGARTFTEIARGLGGSDQSATNWKTRGVPAAVVIQAASIYGVDARWLAGQPDGKEPEFLANWKYSPAPAAPSRPAHVEEHRRHYDLEREEQCLLDAYRLADEGLKRSMLLLARDALDRFGKRRANHR